MRAVVAVVAAILLAGGAGVAAAEQADPGELWEEYPLDPTDTASPPPTTAPPPVSTPTITTAPAGAPATTGVIEAPADESRISGIAAIVALVAGAFVVVTLIFFATRFLTESLLFALSATVKGVPAMSKLFRRRDEDESQIRKGSPEADAEPEAGRPLADMVTSYTAYRATVAPGSEPTAAERPGAASGEEAEPVGERELEPEPVRERDTVRAEAAQAGKYADLGNRIADVLRAAEESSEQLLADARAEAERIRAQAEVDADALRRRTEREFADERTQLERLRAEADSFAETRRRTAEEEASTIRGEAESEARALREAGEEIRRRLEQEGVAKQQQLRAAAGEIEGRLRQVLETSRSVSAELERLLDGTPSGADDATYAEALELQQRRP